jgi:hypothetical protein
MEVEWEFEDGDEPLRFVVGGREYKDLVQPINDCFKSLVEWPNVW